MDKKNKAIFITVRTGSTRLPKKALLEIAGKKTIERLINRVKRSKGKDLVVLCTTTLKEDDILCSIAEENGIRFYRGSVTDKLERWRGAAEKYDVEFFVTADGDDLFCEPELIDLAFRQYDRSKPDFIEGGADIICGSFTYGIKTAALQKVCGIKDTDDTEMMWVYFTQTGLFKTEMLKDVPEIFRRSDIRMTLDYEDDYKFFKTVTEHFLGMGKQVFSLSDIVAFLDENPEVTKINWYLQEKFLNNQKSKTKLVLKRGVEIGKNSTE
jgi:spore coat polysaccharide biosynthesis protein SpsF